jgi:hypothetical protein
MGDHLTSARDLDGLAGTLHATDDLEAPLLELGHGNVHFRILKWPFLAGKRAVAHVQALETSLDWVRAELNCGASAEGGRLPSGATAWKGTDSPGPLEGGHYTDRIVR